MKGTIWHGRETRLRVNEQITVLGSTTGLVSHQRWRWRDTKLHGMDWLCDLIDEAQPKPPS